jgi:hypothetical protein
VAGCCDNGNEVIVVVMMTDIEISVRGRGGERRGEAHLYSS